MSRLSTLQARCYLPLRWYFFRLKLAIKYGQKKFVAHPNVQQLLASIWYSLNQLFPQSLFALSVQILYSIPDHQQIPSFALDRSHYFDSFSNPYPTGMKAFPASGKGTCFSREWRSVSTKILTTLDRIWCTQ